MGRWVVKKSKHDAPNVFDEASPRSWIRPDAPPFFVLHGVIDSLLTVEQARAFVSELRATSKAPVVYTELPFAEHAFDLTQSVRTRGVIPPILSFLNTAYESTRS